MSKHYFAHLETWDERTRMDLMRSLASAFGAEAIRPLDDVSFDLTGAEMGEMDSHFIITLSDDTDHDRMVDTIRGIARLKTGGPVPTEVAMHGDVSACWDILFAD